MNLFQKPKKSDYGDLVVNCALGNRRFCNIFPPTKWGPNFLELPKKLFDISLFLVGRRDRPHGENIK